MGTGKRTKIAVLGGGPGGYAAAILAARLGASVTLIEKNRLGGTCLNEGCIPTKALKQSTDIYGIIKEASLYGIGADPPRLDLASVMKYKEQVVNQLVMGVNYLVKSNGVKLITGEGKIADKNRVQVETNQGLEEIEAEYIIVAAGAKELSIPGFEADGVNILNSSQMLSITELPQRLVIIGGGVIGVEFASIFNKMGVEVSVVELTPSLVPLEDEEITAALQDAMVKRGISVYTGSRAQGYTKNTDGSLSVKVAKGDQMDEICCDKVLVCVGRRAFTEGAGIEELGIELDRGRIVTDACMKTSIGNIFAVGDVTASEQLAHVAYHEARVAVLNIMGYPARADYTAVPHCIFTSPEIASVGLTERAARERYQNIRVARFPFEGNGKALISGNTEGFIKIITEGDTGRILGVSILGPKAAELIAGPTLVVRKGLTASDIVDTIYAHPTLSEVVSEVSLSSIGMGLHLV